MGPAACRSTANHLENFADNSGTKSKKSNQSPLTQAAKLLKKRLHITVFKSQNKSP